MLQKHFSEFRKVVLGRLSENTWYTAGEVVDSLRQCGILVFDSIEVYKQFHFATKAKQYSMVYSALRSLVKPPAGKPQAESAFGDNKGREVRVFRKENA